MMDEGKKEDRALDRTLKDFYQRTEGRPMEAVLDIGPPVKVPVPEGKPTGKTDKGKKEIQVGLVKNHVVINFGKPVAWIAMKRKEAFSLARAIRGNAKKIK